MGRKSIRYFLLMVLSVSLGCSLPTTSVKTVDNRPSIEILNAPEGARLFVDNVNMGPVDKYNGDPNVLLLEPGTHMITVKSQGGAVLYSQKAFLESELKTINVR